MNERLRQCLEAELEKAMDASAGPEAALRDIKQLTASLRGLVLVSLSWEADLANEVKKVRRYWKSKEQPQ